MWSDRSAQGLRVEALGDYRWSLTRKDVDAALIHVSDHWHARMSVNAMKAGRSVHSETPMARAIGQEPGLPRLGTRFACEQHGPAAPGQTHAGTVHPWNRGIPAEAARLAP